MRPVAVAAAGAYFVLTSSPGGSSTTSDDFCHLELSAHKNDVVRYGHDRGHVDKLRHHNQRHPCHFDHQ